MADSAEVLAGIARAPGVRYAALTPNLRGLRGARAARADEVAVFASASEGFSRPTSTARSPRASSVSRPVGAALRRRDAGARLCLLRHRLPLRRADAARGGGAGGRGCATWAATRSAWATRSAGPRRRHRGDAARGAGRGAGRPAGGHYHDTGGRACDNIEASLELGPAGLRRRGGGAWRLPLCARRAGQCGDRGRGRPDRAGLGYDTGSTAR
jgi:hydroxymethylglutaryl-CoA lyase